MPARCFKDNCHLLWSEVEIEGAGPGYEGSLRIDADSSLYCDEAEGGLNVKVAALGANGNILSRTADGHLTAALGAAKHLAASAPDIVFADVPASASRAAPAAAALDLTYTNDSPSDQLVIFRGQFQLHYDVLWEGNGSPESPYLKRSGDLVTRDPAGAVPARSLNAFNAQWVARLSCGHNGGAITPVVADHFTTSGVVPNIDSNVFKSEWRGFVWMTKVDGGGGTVVFQGDIYHDGPEQSLNIATSPAQQFDANDANAPARGFRIANVDLYALPIRVDG